MTIYAVNGKEPVAAWIPSLDTAGNGTTTLTDLVGTNNGTLTNMDAATDWVSDTGAGGVRALTFDGANDYVDCGTGLAIPGNLTMQAWAKCTAIGGTYQMISGRSTDNPPYQQNYLLIQYAGYWRANIQTGSTYWELLGPAVVLNQWTHLFMVLSGTTFSLWVDGVETSRTISGTPVVTGTQKFYIGAQYKSPYTRPFSGSIDDVRVFDSALTAPDISYLYNSGNGRGRVSTIRRQQRSQQIIS